MNENKLRVKEWKGEKSLIIESDRLEEYLNFIKSNAFKRFKGIILSKDLGYKLDNINFFNEIPFLKSVSISDMIPDLSGLYLLPELKILNLANNKQDIDLSKFISLEELSYDWNKKVKNLDQCKRLQKLIIGGFNPKSKSIDELPVLGRLTDLTIIKSTIINLTGMSNFYTLKRLELSYMSKLERLDGLDIDSLEYLEFSVCRKISNHSYVERLKNLDTLKLNDCGKIDSINFIRNIPKLKMFTFVNTNVIDGDMTPCFDLEFVGFLNKKHYSHTPEEVREIISKAA